MNKITYFFLALLGLGASILAGQAIADDVILPASISGLSIYTAPNGSIHTPDQGGCVINTGAKVYLAANSFSFGPGFEVQAGAALVTMKATSDGLFDIWKIKWFGDNYSRGPYDDPDGDGLNNLAEYELGTDPTDSANSLNPPGPGTYYFYDDLGRMIGVYKFSETGFQHGFQYRYDGKGNRTSLTLSAGG